MSIRYTRVALALLVPLLAVCAKYQPEDETAALEGGVEVREGAIVISGAPLAHETGSVIDALVGRVPNFRVRELQSECPQILLRSNVSFESITNPHVYVDGTRINDTCVLESLRARNVEVVEIYPMGFTTRPGYSTHAHGLILVFLVSGSG